MLGAQVMNVLPLIGAHLKSDDIIDFLELWDAVVVYDFDRLHENTPDCYRVTAPSAGMELLFNANQILETLFLRLVSSDDFAPFDITNSDVTFWHSIDEARQFAAVNNLTSTEGNAFFLGVQRNWIKLDHGAYTSHYEFVGSKLNMVTLALQMQSQ
jgi:hypothetical protein